MHSTVAKPALAETIVQKIVFPLGWWYFPPSVPSLELSAVVQHFYLCSLFAHPTYGCTSQKLLRVCPTTSSCWALSCFFHLSGPAHCPLVWIMLLFVYGGLVFFSFIYILSLFRRIQTIWRLRGWRLCWKLCSVCAAFLDSTSFFKYNPCHFLNIILVSRGF